MSEPQEVLFEITVVKDEVGNTRTEAKTLGISLDVAQKQLRILVNGVDIGRTMKISSLKIVKVF